jgi:lysophospholipase L1-like esterase
LPPEKPGGEFRILCIGDSVTFGFNVDQSDSYPERLQAALRARFPGRPIRVINAGTPGWSWLQGVLFLEREGLALHPDLVIMAHGANDRFFAAKITDAERIGELRRPGVRWVESGAPPPRADQHVSPRAAVVRAVDERQVGSLAACQKQLAKEGKCTPRRAGRDRGGGRGREWARQKTPVPTSWC